MAALVLTTPAAAEQVGEIGTHWTGNDNLIEVCRQTGLMVIDTIETDEGGQEIFNQRQNLASRSAGSGPSTWRLGQRSWTGAARQTERTTP